MAASFPVHFTQIGLRYECGQGTKLSHRDAALNDLVYRTLIPMQNDLYDRCLDLITMPHHESLECMVPELYCFLPLAEETHMYSVLIIA